MKKKACNLLPILLALVFAALWSKANTAGNIGTCALSLGVVLLSRILPSMRRNAKPSCTIAIKAIAVLIGLAVGWNFYRVFETSGLIQRIAESLGLAPVVPLLLLTALRAALAIYSCLLFFRYLLISQFNQTLLQTLIELPWYLKNPPVLLFAFASFHLWANYDLTKNLSICVLSLCMVILSRVLPSMRGAARQRSSITEKIISALIGIAAGWRFYRVLEFSGFILPITESLGHAPVVLLLILSILRAALAFYTCSLFFRLLTVLPPFELKASSPETDGNGRVGFKAVVFLFLVALFTITICSKSSPIYPLNDWVDSNCYFTVGKSLLNGRVMYRDLFEHKGPLLYALHAVAYLISNTTFLGVYFFEVIAAFAFLFFAYRIALLYCDRDVLFLIPLFAAVVYGNASFAHGDSAEELCLPFLAYALYVGLRSLRYAKPLSNRTFFIIGVTSGCILWIKYTMLGFYLGWYAVLAWDMIAQRRWSRLWKSAVSVAAGVFVISVPVFLYFILNHALSDFFLVYFYDNIFLYSISTSSIPILNAFDNILSALHFVVERCSSLTLLILCGLIGLYMRNDRKTFHLFLCSLLSMIYLIYTGGQKLVYYAFALSIFTINALPIVYSIGKGLLRRQYSTTWHRLLLCAAGSVLACVLSNNTYLLAYQKEDMPQYRFKEIIETVDNPTLLNYSFLDGGFYTVCNIVPNNKYFCVNNVPLPEMQEAQNASVEQGLTDFLVTRDLEITPSPEKYECIATEEFTFENSIFVYRLYALKELGLQ